MKRCFLGVASWLAVLLVAMAAPAQPSQGDEFSTFSLGSPSEEAWWFVAEIEAQKAEEAEMTKVAEVRDRYRKKMEDIWQALEQALTRLPVPEEGAKPPVDNPEPAPNPSREPPPTKRTQLGAELVAGLFSHLKQQAEHEVLNFFLTRVVDRLCTSSAASWLRATCQVVEDRKATLLGLQAAVRLDIQGIPGRLAALSADLPPSMICVLTVVGRLQEPITTQQPIAAALAVIDEMLRSPACGVFGEASERALRAMRLLAAIAVAGETSPGALVEAAEKAIRKRLELPSVPDDTLQRAEKRLQAIELVLSKAKEGVARERWAEARQDLVVALLTARFAQQKAWSEANAELDRVVAAYIRQQPFARLAGSVVRALGADVAAEQAPGDPAMQVPEVLRGATSLLIDIVAASPKVDQKDRAAAIRALRITERLATGDYRAAIELLASSPEVQRVRSLGPLLASARLLAGLAGAQDAAEVQALLAEEAAPAGTWAARRDGRMVAVSGQFGFGGAVETLGERGRAAALGLSAPVGLDISFPAGTWAVDLMLQLLDLGSMGTARLSEDHIEPRLGLVQVLAPGARVGLGLGNSPFMLSVAVDFVPALRTVDDEAQSVFRAGLALGVDIPLLVLE
jgi:hypothetical protein